MTFELQNRRLIDGEGFLGRPREAVFNSASKRHLPFESVVAPRGGQIGQNGRFNRETASGPERGPAFWNHSFLQHEDAKPKMP